MKTIYNPGDLIYLKGGSARIWKIIELRFYDYGYGSKKYLIENTITKKRIEVYEEEIYCTIYDNTTLF